MKTASIVTAFVLLGSSVFAQGTRVRVDANSPRGTHVTTNFGPQTLVGPSVCSEVARAWEGQALAGGASLSPNAFMNSATVSNGRIAFIADVVGSARNQGVFWADAAGVHAIAQGSGGGGGSGVPGAAVGDLSPIGGRFTGFFQGTAFAPALNANGDVLFMADVFGGSSTRGLFLYRAATQTIVKVAALGDASPAGGTLFELGTGALNDAGTVAFLANGQASANTQVLRWTNGVLTKIAQDGDVAPGGGNYASLWLMSFGFVDGTTIPVSPPDINDAGNVAFGALTNVDWGFVFQTPAGAAQWYVKQGDATPIGGVYLDFWNPILNNADQIAFMTDVDLGGGNYGGGWMVGKPGTWRKALAWYDIVEGMPVNVLGISTSPQSPLADNGDLVAWCDAARECIVLSRANGTQEVLAGAGDATPIGGTIGFFDSWPSMDAAGEVTMSCTTPGATNGASSAHFVLNLCVGATTTYCTAGTTQIGCVPSISGTGTPSASASSGFAIEASDVPGQSNGILFYGVGGRVAVPWYATSSSFMCVKAPVERTGLRSSGGTLNVCDGSLDFDFNTFRATHPAALGQPMTAGLVVDAQAWFRDPGAPKNTNLSDALEFTLAP